MRPRFAWLVGILITLAPIPAHAQPWSGILSPSRAIDWRNVGIPGGIPKRTTICATLNPGATAAQINSAIAACPSGQVVFLNAGTYNLSSGITFNNKSNVTLRGAGADLTRLIFTGGTPCHSGGNAASICLDSSDSNWVGGPSNSANWTAGYAKGTTVITLSSTSNLAVGNFLILDQLNDSVDAGGIFVCGGSPCTGEGPSGGQRFNREQMQLVKVVAISGNQVTISPGLHMPNWLSSQSPQAWWPTAPIKNSGIEDMSLDHTLGPAQAGVRLFNSMNCWMKGIRSIGAGRNHVWLYIAFGTVIRDSYFYGGKTSGSESYGIEWFPGGDTLVENNIFQHVTAPLVQNAAMTGDVVAYNFSIDNYYTANGSALGWMQPTFVNHAGGDSMILLEGNDGLGIQSDNIHGTHHFVTLFRNHFYGDIFNNPPKNGNTTVMHFWAYSRFFNVVGNVLGRPGYYNTYESNLTRNERDIFSFGEPDSRRSTSDPLVRTTLMRWGNYDNVTGTRFNAVEVPANLSQFPNFVPPNSVLPNSFYLVSKPGWFGAVPWPAIGPDVGGGNAPGSGEHAHKIPARLCYENSPIDSVYGSANVRLFNAKTCYPQSDGQVPTPPAALVVQ